MWSRAALKDNAKSALSRNYWKCVLVSLIITVLAGGGSTISLVQNVTYTADSYDEVFGNITDEMWSRFFVLGAILLVVIVIGWIIAAVWSYLVVLPLLHVGSSRFFMENSYGETSAAKMFFAFTSGHYWKIVGILFLQNLFITLWTFLFIIPGIVKSYEYRMVPYLLADCPELSRKEAFRISKEMMQGQKMDAFILDLSFIGWDLLSGLTLGILALFYVTPYRYATNAELFLELKRQYFANRTYTDM